MGDPGSIPGSGRPHGEEHDNLLQYSCLENPQKQMSLMGCSLLQEGGHDFVTEHACIKWGAVPPAHLISMGDGKVCGHTEPA